MGLKETNTIAFVTVELVGRVIDRLVGYDEESSPVALGLCPRHSQSIASRVYPILTVEITSRAIL